MTEPTVTDRRLADMFRENTGRALCDSGDAYGRNYERHSGRTVEDMLAAPETRVETWRADDWYVTLDAFHWLRDRLAYDPDDRITRLWHKWIRSAHADDSSYLTDVETFLSYLEHAGVEIRYGMYGEGSRDSMWVNTYNNEDALSQTLQLATFSIGGQPYVLLQVHGGCDVRGGYTVPEIFLEASYDETAMYDNARIYGQCEHGHMWDTYDAGCRWEYNGCQHHYGNRDYPYSDDSLLKGQAGPVVCDAWSDGADRDSLTAELDEDENTTGRVLCPCGAPMSFGAS